MRGERITNLKIVGAIVAMLVSPAAMGQDCVTEVPGGPVVGETWTQAGSPYCVTGDLFISNLTIEPGVQVLIDGPWRLNVQTTIDARGTAEEPIVFTAKDPDASKWGGMEFDHTVPGSVLQYCHFSHANDSALRLLDTAPTIERCTFTDNTARLGGAVLVHVNTVIPLVQSCRFENNSADWGGALYVNGSVNVLDSMFDSNDARDGGGGAMALRNGDIELVGCLLRDNLADDGTNPRGGAIDIDSVGTATLSNLIIGGNRSSGGCCGRRGGGIYMEDSGAVAIHNVTFARNDPHALHVERSEASVRNSIFWQNNNDGSQISGEVCIDFSCIQNGYNGGCAGDNNITFNPSFSGSGTSLCDLTILEFSPCIDAGDPDEAFNDSTDCARPPFGTERNDMGAHGGPGACWSVPLCPSPANINGDCAIDADDFFAYLDLFSASDPAADIDGDGDIDAEDFFAFLDHFAQGCP